MAKWQETWLGYGDSWPLALSRRMDSGIQGSLRSSTIYYIHGEIRRHVVQRSTRRLRLRDLRRQRWVPKTPLFWLKILLLYILKYIHDQRQCMLYRVHFKTIHPFISWLIYCGKYQKMLILFSTFKHIKRNEIFSSPSSGLLAYPFENGNRSQMVYQK